MAGHITGKKELIDKANSRIFATVIIASLIVSASLVATKILWDQRSFQSRVIDAKVEVNDQLQANIEASKQLVESFEDFEEGDVNSRIVLDALPSKYDYAAVSTSIEKIVNNGGASLDSFSGSDDSSSAIDSEAEPSPQPIEFSVEVLGSYDDIKEFVTKMERSIRPFKVLNVTIEDQDEEGISATIKMETYYQPTRSLEITTQEIQ